MNASVSPLDAPQPHPLLRSPSPATIRGFLLQPDRDRFVTEYETVMDEARRNLDLDPVLQLVEHWRGIAMLHSDPRAFRTGVRRWAETVTGEPSPDNEPFDVTRRKAGI